MKILSAPYSIRERFIERSGRSKLYILSHPVFWVVLAAKIAAATVFGAKALTENYAPLVSYFTGAALSNPYTWALDQGIHFPFPAAMLFVLAAAKFALPFITAATRIAR